MKLTVNQLEIFIEVARQGSMTKAAKMLHRTQPAISIQLKELERRCGAKLFNVIGKKLFLTAAGEQLLSICSSIQEKIRDIPHLLSVNANHLSGVFKISIVSTAQYFIPQLLGDFRRHYPDVNIKLTVTNRETVLQRLQDNQDDLVILSQLPRMINIVTYPILDDHLVLIAPPDHRLAKRSQLRFSDLAQEDFIVREIGSGTRMVMEKIFSKHKIVPKISLQLGSGEAVKQAVIGGMGISLVSEHSIKQEIKLKKLAVLKLSGFPIRHTWYAVYPKSKSVNLVAKKFLEMIKRED